MLGSMLAQLSVDFHVRGIVEGGLAKEKAKTMA
jgi:hypothetical protein